MKKSHKHGPACGHEAVPHGDHTDYFDGHLHHPHGDHWDLASGVIGGRLELRVQPRCEYGNRSPIAVVAGIENQLIVRAHPPAGPKRQAVISFENLLGAGMRQLSIPDEDAEAAGIEKGRMHIRDAVDDAPIPHVWSG